MIDLGHYRAGLDVICRQYRVRELAIFGSAVRDDFGPDSDIDVIVEFTGRDDLFLRFMDLKVDLETLFGRPVDVIMPEGISNPVFKEEVLQQRVPVYAA